MLSQKAGIDKQKFRHRLQEIKLEPDKLTHDVTVEIQADGTSVHKLPDIKGGRLLHWTNQCLPCDVHNDSTITLQVTEIHTFRDRVGRASYQVSQVKGQDSMSIVCDSENFKLELKFLDNAAHFEEDSPVVLYIAWQAKRVYSEAFVRVQRMEARLSLVERAGKVGEAFKVLLTLGSTMADLDPTGGANIVFSVCTMAWEHLENQEKQSGELVKLVENLARMIPSIESIKGLADENLKQTVIVMLNLIEDASLFIINYNSQGAWEQTWRSAFSSDAQKQVEGFVDKFKRLRKEFDTRVNVQALRAAEVDRIQSKLRELKPVDLASYDPARECIAGTRVDIIRDVVEWSQKPDAGTSLAWVQGLAGLGKSSIATSVCRRLDEQRLLACSFFCKRDSPDLRDPRRVLTTIMYGLAHRWEAYGEAVITVIREDPELHSRHIQPLYEALVSKPLQKLTGTQQLPGVLVIVVDALDECGDIATRKQLLVCLRSIPQVISSIRVVVTSRPDPDIQEFFARSDGGWFMEYNVLRYDALADIRVLVQEQLGDMARIDNWPKDAVKRLTVRSSGLFIWARTVCNLSSVLYVDQSLDGAVRISHPSFMDFITNPSRSSELCVNLDQQNYILGECCLETMINHLRFNICKLETSDALNSDIPDLNIRVQGAISPQLKYSCLYWSSHVVQANTVAMDALLCEFLFERQLLYWIEALSLMGKLGVALSALSEFMAYCTSDDMQRHRAAANDAYRFVLTYYDFISSSTPHLYISALAFAPERSQIAQRMRKWFPKLLAVTQGVAKKWTPCRRTIWTASNVFLVALSPDSHRIVSGSDNAVRIWDAETGDSVIGPLQGHSGEVYSVAFSHDGLRIASGSTDGTVRVWDARTGDAIRGPPHGHSKSVVAIVFSRDDCRIASYSCDATLCIWDASTGGVVSRTLQLCSDETFAAAFSHDGRRLAVESPISNSSYDIRIWDTETGTIILDLLHGHSSGVRCIAFSFDGHLVISGSYDKTVRIWDLNTGNPMLDPLRGHSRSVRSVAFSHGGRRIASGSDDTTIRVWDAQTGDALMLLQGHTGYFMWTAMFSCDGSKIVSSSSDGTIRIWDIVDETSSSTSHEAHTVEQGMKGVGSIEFSPDGLRFVSGSGDGTVRIWDADTGDAVLKPLRGRPGAVAAVAFSLDGRRIISCCKSGAIRVWDAETGDTVSQLQQDRLCSAYSIALSSDGRHIVSGFKDGSVCTWDVGTGDATFEPRHGHEAEVTRFVFSRDGCRFASGSSDGIVRIWDAQTGETVLEPLRGQPSPVHLIAFSPDSRRIASAGSESEILHVWDVETGDAVFEPLRGHESHVLAATFTTDGRFIVSCTNYGALHVWNTENGAAVFEPLRHTLSFAHCVASSPNGYRLVSGLYDGAISIWDLEKCAALNSPNSDCLPDTQVRIFPSQLAESGLVSTSAQLARRVNSAGWVMTVEGKPLLWLPPELRGVNDWTIWISHLGLSRQIIVDLTDFVHGNSWTSVTSV